MTADLDALLADEPIAAPTLNGAVGRKLKPVPDPDRIRRNRNNRKRGKGTSKDLAEYLGLSWQNVETLNWPWDVQGPGGRIQSKREQAAYGPVAALRIIRAIPEGNWLRGLFYVPPSRRLVSGTITTLLSEWVDWHGWAPMRWGVVAAGSEWMLTMPLPVFRDLHCSTGDGTAA